MIAEPHPSPRGRLLAATVAIAGLWLAGPPAAGSERGGQPPAAESAATSVDNWKLVDVAAETGISWVNLHGGMEEKRYILESNGSGLCLFDYDGDGLLDIYLVNGGDLETLAGTKPAPRNALYRNLGGWRFEEVTERSGVGDDTWGMGCAVGDVDGDGLPDLYVTNFGPNVLYLNQGDGTFRQAAAEAGQAKPDWSHSAAFGDFTGDGHLDLYVTNYLTFDLDHVPTGPCSWRGIAVPCGPVGFPPQLDRLFFNDGTGRFRDASAESGIHAPDPDLGLGVALADFDGDGLVDIAVANDSGPDFLFRNLGRGRFEEVAWLVGTATQAEGRMQAGMGISWGDVNGNSRPDLLVTNFAFDHDTLHLNQGEVFQDASFPSGIGRAGYLALSWGTVFADLDHDGHLDLYIANGHLYPEVDGGSEESFRQPDHLLVNDGSGRFDDQSHRIVRPRGPAVSRGLAMGDLEGDGDLDLVVLEMGEPPTLLRNEGGSTLGAWLLVFLRGEAPTEGEGAVILAHASGRAQRRDVTRSGSYLSNSDVRAHFGLADAEVVDRLEVRWPRGRRQAFLDLPARRQVVLCERLACR